MAVFPLRSMTGFGQAQKETSRGVFNVELRSVNNRFLDINLALPRELSVLESAIRTLLKQEIRRGKVDCRVRYTPGEEAQTAVTINVELARHYAEQIRQIQGEAIGREVSLDLLLTMPGVVESQQPTIDEQVIWRYLRGVLEQAIEALNRERAREGNAMGQQLHELAAQLRADSLQIEQNKDEVARKYRERLAARLTELEAETAGKVDPGRLEMETAIYADRCDITEELVRLGAHVERFEELITQTQEEPPGKSLEFLIQELVREINTICSKARDTTITEVALDMKLIVERIREQVSNIE